MEILLAALVSAAVAAAVVVLACAPAGPWSRLPSFRLTHAQASHHEGRARTRRLDRRAADGRTPRRRPEQATVPERRRAQEPRARAPPRAAQTGPAAEDQPARTPSCARGARSWRGSRSGCAPRRGRSTRGSRSSTRERSFADRARNLEQNAARLKESKREHLRELERVAGLSAGQAKQILLRELEDELRHDSARLIRQVEEETRHDADRRARSILATCMQRVAGGHAVETTVSVVELKSDELKGRIIGREGRNIRTLETLTGIDFIIDDTPGAVLLSGLRRRPPRGRAHHAREAAPGRPHPSGPDRGGLRAGALGDRPADRRGRRAGGLRGQRRDAAPRADQAARPASLPNELRPERAAPLDRVRAAGVPAGRRAGRQRQDGRPRRPPARHRQGGVPRGGGPARARRRRAGAALQGVRGGGPRDGGPPQRGRAPDRRGRDRADRGLSVRRPSGRARGLARAVREQAPRSRADRGRATTASRRCTPCTLAARSG